MEAGRSCRATPPRAGLCRERSKLSVAPYMTRSYAALPIAVGTFVSLSLQPHIMLRAQEGRGSTRNVQGARGRKNATESHRNRQTFYFGTRQDRPGAANHQSPSRKRSMARPQDVLLLPFVYPCMISVIKTKMQKIFMIS